MYINAHWGVIHTIVASMMRYRITPPISPQPPTPDITLSCASLVSKVSTRRRNLSWILSAFTECAKLGLAFALMAASLNHAMVSPCGAMCAFEPATSWMMMRFSAVKNLDLRPGLALGLGSLSEPSSNPTTTAPVSFAFSVVGVLFDSVSMVAKRTG